MQNMARAYSVIGQYESEKFDGYRAYFDHEGRQFYARQGKKFSKYEWFIKRCALKQPDGELWIDESVFKEWVP